MKTFEERVSLAVPDVPAEHAEQRVTGGVKLTIALSDDLPVSKRSIRRNLAPDKINGGGRVLCVGKVGAKH